MFAQVVFDWCYMSEGMSHHYLMKRNRAVVEYTQCRVRTKSKLTNLKIILGIEGYNDK